MSALTVAQPPSVEPAAALASAPSLGSAPPILFSDRSCPFAHRVLALIDHLGCPADRRESMIGDKPEGIFRHSASGRIPLLVHGDLVITESRVMLEHLAEYHGFSDAYPADLAARTSHRHAMAVTDDFLAALLLGPADAEPPATRLDDVLRTLQEAAATVPPHPCLLALHVAPLWLRFRVWQPAGAVTRAIEARPALRQWLDAAIELHCISRSAPDPATHADDVAMARRTGLLP